MKIKVSTLLLVLLLAAVIIYVYYSQQKKENLLSLPKQPDVPSIEGFSQIATTFPRENIEHEYNEQTDVTYI